MLQAPRAAQPLARPLLYTPQGATTASRAPRLPEMRAVERRGALLRVVAASLAAAAPQPTRADCDAKPRNPRHLDGIQSLFQTLH